MNDQFICSSCGFVGNPRTFVKGNFGIEVILWLLFLVPGLIYTIWRLTTKQSACPQCKKPTMIPVASPVGQELALKYNTPEIRSKREENIKRLSDQRRNEHKTIARALKIIFAFIIIILIMKAFRLI